MNFKIGTDTEQINSNNKVKKSTTYQLFQNIVKDTTKEYNILQNYYNFLDKRRISYIFFNIKTLLSVIQLFR
jgi:hypothetical protein